MKVYARWTNVGFSFCVTSYQHFILNQVKAKSPNINAKVKLCINQIQARTSPPGKPPGNFFEVVKSPAPGQNFPAKARPPGQKTPTPGEYFRRSSQPFLLTGVEILGFFRNQLLERIGRLSSYSLVIPSSFSLSTILKSFKVFPQH